MENIFDCNEGKMQIFSPLCKNIFSAQVLALCFGISTGSRLESARKFETSYEVIENNPKLFFIIDFPSYNLGCSCKNTNESEYFA